MKPANHISVVLVASIALAAAGQTGKAEAVTAAVAKAHARSLAKAFPLPKPGNPAPGAQQEARRISGNSMQSASPTAVA